MPFLVGFITFFLLSFAGNAIVGDTVCNDGWASPSIGKQGACSHHGGVNKLPGYLVMIVSVFGGFMAGSYYSGIQSRSHHPSRVDGTFRPEENETQTTTHHSTDVSCPICGSSMVERVARKGRYQGNHFYGCSRYPSCKGIINKDKSD